MNLLVVKNYVSLLSNYNKLLLGSNGLWVHFLNQVKVVLGYVFCCLIFVMCFADYSRVWFL
jgi:nucleoside permease NupC